MSCDHELNLEIDRKVFDLPDKVLLMGNPNVGKSVIFSELTGVRVMSSNYAGTTVTYTKAKMNISDEEFQLIDVPGTYSLSAVSEAEKVAVSFMNSGAKVVICVLDATNLTRNLNLAYEIIEHGIPIVFVLNLTDIAERKGIIIDKDMLQDELGYPVINMVAVKGIGFDLLKSSLLNAAKLQSKPRKDEISQKNQKDIWDKSKELSKKVISSTDKDLTKIDKLGDLMVKPMPGIPIAILILFLSLAIIVGGGKALRAVLFLPLVNDLIVPFFRNLISTLGFPEMLENILIGEYGVFVIGFEWPIALIMPYVTLFYIVFTFLEDCGFLPRMAVLFDGLMRKMGVQGGSLISLVMGYGCAVPAIIGTRNSTTRKERIIVTAMVCFAVPCISQSAAFIALFADYSMMLLVAIFALSFIIIFIVGLITGKILKGKIDPIVLEIPNLLLPEKKAYFKKIGIRLKSFLFEAEGPMMVAIVIAAVLKESGALDIVAGIFEPVVSGLLGLPKDAVISLLLGVIRREMAIAPLLDSPVPLTALQIFVGGTVGLLYLPCLSVFGVIAKEFNSKVAVAIGVSTFCTAFLIGGLINFIGNLF